MGQDVCQLVIGWQIYLNLFREYEISPLWHDDFDDWYVIIPVPHCFENGYLHAVSFSIMCYQAERYFIFI